MRITRTAILLVFTSLIALIEGSAIYIQQQTIRTENDENAFLRVQLISARSSAALLLASGKFDPAADEHAFVTELGILQGVSPGTEITMYGVCGRIWGAHRSAAPGEIVVDWTLPQDSKNDVIGIPVSVMDHSHPLMTHCGGAIA